MKQNKTNNKITHGCQEALDNNVQGSDTYGGSPNQARLSCQQGLHENWI